MVFATPSPPEKKSASTDRPRGCLEDLELRVGARELLVLERDQVWKAGLHRALERRNLLLAAQLDGDHRGSVLMEEALCRAKWHEYAAVLKAVRGLEHADHMKGPMSDLHVAAHGCRQEVGSPLAQNDIVVMLAEVRTIALDPGRLANPGVCLGHAEAGDDRMIRAGYNAEQHRIRVLHHRPARDLLSTPRVPRR